MRKKKQLNTIQPQGKQQLHTRLQKLLTPPQKHTQLQSIQRKSIQQKITRLPQLQQQLHIHMLKKKK